MNRQMDLDKIKVGDRIHYYYKVYKPVPLPMKIVEVEVIRVLKKSAEVRLPDGRLTIVRPENLEALKEKRV